MRLHLQIKLRFAVVIRAGKQSRHDNYSNEKRTWNRTEKMKVCALEKKEAMPN